MVLASSFPGTVVTKDHMLGDFKPQTLVFSRFWRPDVQNQSVGGALPPRKVLGEGPPSLLAAVVPTSVPRLWPRGSSLGLHGHPASSSPRCLLCGSLSHLPLPRNCKDTCGLHLGPTQLVGVKSFLSRFLTKSPVKTQIFLPNKVTLTGSPEKAMATHSSTLAWSIPWAEEPGGLQSMGSHRVGHD